LKGDEIFYDPATPDTAARRLRVVTSRSNYCCRDTGFTLIEVLIAVVIFALMATVAYRGLGAILESKRHIDAENEKWRKISLFFIRLERDLAVAAPRPIRAATQLADAMNGEATASRDNDAQLAFTRMGNADDTSELGAPRRVGYRLRNNNIELLLWPVLDQGPRTVPESSVLLSNVSDLKFRYLDNGKPRLWQTRWPQIGAPQGGTPTGSIALPKAVEVTVTLQSGEVLTRLFEISISS